MHLLSCKWVTPEDTVSVATYWEEVSFGLTERRWERTLEKALRPPAHLPKPCLHFDTPAPWNY